MRYIIFVIFMLMVSNVMADTVQIDVSSWTQEQKNMTAAMSYQLLYKAGITYQKVNFALPVIEVISPSAAIDTVLTKQKIEDEYASWKIISDAATAAETQKQAERQTEIDSNTLKNVTLSQVDTAINNIGNLSDAKIFLKRLVRYLDAKGLLDN